MKRLHAIITGDVTGVGFRAWIRDKAKKLGVTGWVKNREDDAVELVGEGSKEALDALLVACRKGPDVAWVQSVETEWTGATGEFLSFEVLY